MTLFQGARGSGAKRSRREADHSFSSNDEFIIPGAIYPLSHKSS
jgi:hypothetical protein